MLYAFGRIYCFILIVINYIVKVKHIFAQKNSVQITFFTKLHSFS